MDDWVRELTAIAAKHGGVISTEHLRAVAAPTNALARLERDGWLRRERRGVYAFTTAPRTWHQQLHAAALAANAVISHSCAATLWEFRHLPYQTLEVTVTRAHRSDLPGLTVHHVTSLADVDVTHRFGPPITTFERTLVDCSTVLSEFQLSSNLDDGLRRRVASLRALRECVDRLRSGPGRRLALIESLLDVRSPSYDPGGSNSERRVLDILVAGGLPAPVQQYRVRVEGKTYFLDYAYPEHLLFIEYYGGGWHGTPSAMVYDSDRISDLTTLRWKPLIFTDATPDRVMVERTQACLGL
jgi:hypothetical protein